MDKQSTIRRKRPPSKTPVIDQQIFEVPEEPFVWYEEPIVVGPERNPVLALLLTNYSEKLSKKIVMNKLAESGDRAW